jgi:hypothetical protein
VRTPLFVIACLAAASAHAQATITTFDFDALTTVNWNRATCDTNTLLNFEMTGQAAQYQWRVVQVPLQGNNGACPNDLLDPLSDVVFGPESIAPAAGTVVMRNRRFPLTPLMGNGACAMSGVDGAFVLCAQVYLLAGDVTALSTSPIAMTVDTIVPTAPTLSVFPQSGRIEVTAQVLDASPTDAFTYVVESRPCVAKGDGEGEGAVGEGEGDGEGEGETGTGETESGPSSRCAAGVFSRAATGASPLTLTTTSDDNIEIRVRAVDRAKNEGPPSPNIVTASVPDVGPLGLYDGEPNALSCDPSGCGGAQAGVVLLPLVFLRRRRRHALSSGAAAVLLCVLAAGAASAADTRDTAIWNGLSRNTLTLGLSAYTPALDEEGAFPVYSCFFGDSPRARVGMANGIHLLDIFGSLQLHVSADITQASGLGQPTSASRSGKCETPTQTTVQLTMATVTLGLQYAFDPLLDLWAVPLVPYGRVGLVGHGYGFTRGGSFDSSGASSGQKPVGVRFGAEAALGLMLALDFLDAIDPFSAHGTARARANGVLDHTFIFVEGAFMQIDSFGRPGPRFTPKDTFLDTSFPVVWKAGLAVELL